MKLRKDTLNNINSYIVDRLITKIKIQESLVF